jgi:DNA replication and repair protein RecF
VLIKEIKLENFRSYDFLELPINRGINLIYGDNGSGKSSIIESINYTLSGKSFRTTETNNLIRQNTDQLQALIVFF